MKLLVINGPNLNFLGIREKGIYGYQDYNDLVNTIEKKADELGVSVSVFQSNIEGEIVDAIQKAIGKEILAKWNNGTDFNGFVEAEIRHQVETWITNNMNDVIENIVKKEVERVIAKVSS